MKNFKKTALALVVTLVAGYGVYTSQQKSELSELVLANIEAIAQNESGDYSQKIWEHFIVQMVVIIVQKQEMKLACSNYNLPIVFR